MLNDIIELKHRCQYQEYLNQGGAKTFEDWRRDHNRYQPVYISYPSWEEPGPLFHSREEAQGWIDRKCHRPGDWGYVIDGEAA